MKFLGRIVLVVLLVAVGYGVARYALARTASAETATMQSQLEAARVRVDNAETRVKELTDNPIKVTEVVTREVPVEVEKVVEVTKVITVEVPTEADQTQTPLVLTSDTSTACRHTEWFNGANAALNTTTDVAGLLAKLDRDYVLAEGGQWSNGGFTVPAGSVFWTDLLKSNLPTYVSRIRTEGNWGVYATARDYTIPSPNGGGRFVRICESVVGIPVQKTAPTPVSATAKLPTCVTSIEVGIITSAENPGKEYDSFFEGKGYLYGKAFKPGETANAGWLLHANAAVFTTTEPIKLEGGRGMPICK